jgi:hypothetical protein
VNRKNNPVISRVQPPFLKSQDFNPLIRDKKNTKLTNLQFNRIYTIFI